MSVQDPQHERRDESPLGRHSSPSARDIVAAEAPKPRRGVGMLIAGVVLLVVCAAIMIVYGIVAPPSASFGTRAVWESAMIWISTIVGALGVVLIVVGITARMRFRREQPPDR
jgi:hypothetical protein